MPTTRELHRRAMELLDEALYVANSEIRVEGLFRRALASEALAADSVADRPEVEPTRSVLHQAVASLALRLGEIDTAKKYIAAAMQGQPPSEIRRELVEIRGQVAIREAMTKKSRSRLRKYQDPVDRSIVKETIAKYTGQIPVDIRGMLRSFGLTLIRESKATMGEDRGMIEKNLRKGGFSGYLIVVNQDYSLEDQRVAAAHELTHYFNDRDRFTDRLRDNRMYSSGLATHVEELADKVALDWLIPGEHLAAKRKEVGENPEELAKIFRVPVLEMKIRMKIIRKRIRWSDV